MNTSKWALVAVLAASFSTAYAADRDAVALTHYEPIHQIDMRTVSARAANALQEYDPESGLPQVSITLDNDGGVSMNNITKDRVGDPVDRKYDCRRIFGALIVGDRVGHLIKGLIAVI